MNLIEYTQQNSLALSFPDGTTRPAAEVFAIEDGSGIAFANLGWTDPLFSGHPFHLVEGEITGKGPFNIGDVKLYKIHEQDDLAMDFLYWHDAIRGRDDHELRKQCKSAIENEFSVKLSV